MKIFVDMLSGQRGRFVVCETDTVASLVKTLPTSSLGNATSAKSQSDQGVAAQRYLKFADRQLALGDTFQECGIASGDVLTECKPVSIAADDELLQVPSPLRLGGDGMDGGHTSSSSDADMVGDSGAEPRDTDKFKVSSVVEYCVEYKRPMKLPDSLVDAVTMNAQIFVWPLGGSCKSATIAGVNGYECTHLNSSPPLCLGSRTELSISVFPCKVSNVDSHEQ